MAKEILGLYTTLMPRGTGHDLIVFVLVNPLIKDANDNAIVPTPYLELPEEVRTGITIPLAMQNALDNGTAMFVEVKNVERPGWMNDAQFRAHLVTLYNKRKNSIVARERVKWANFGKWVDVT